MLAALRTVLLTLSSNFSETIFFRLPGMKETPDVIMEKFMDPAHRPAGEKTSRILHRFAEARTGTSLT